jgi:hypothetical protein
MLDRRRLTKGRARSGGDNPVATQIKRKSFGIPVTGTPTSILDPVTDDETEQTITEGFTQPDMPRVISAYVVDNGGDAANIGAISVTIHGTNAADITISETLPAFNPSAPVGVDSEVVGLKAFKTVTSVVIPAHNAAGVQTSIGLPHQFDTTFLGVGRVFTRNTYLRHFLDGVSAWDATKLVVDSSLEKNVLVVGQLGVLVELDYYTI